MYKIVLSRGTPIDRVQDCTNELKHKVIWQDFDLDTRTLLIDASESSPDDVRGTLYSTIGVEYIDEFDDMYIALNNNRCSE